MLDIAENVSTAWAAHTLAEKGRAPSGQRTYTWASGYKRCQRAMEFDLTQPQDSTFGQDTLERFYFGDEFERSVVSRLIQAGQRAQPRFDVEGGQDRFEIKDRSGRVIIVGRIDGFLVWNNPRVRVPFEVKSGVSVQNIHSVDAFDRGKWTPQMLRQLLIYMLAFGCDQGLFILHRPGAPLFLPVSLDDANLERAEDFMIRAELAVDVKEGKADLSPFHPDPGECLRCDHRGRSCAPPVESGEGLQMVIDEALEESAQLVVDNEKAAKDYARARKHIAKSFRGKPLVSIGGRFTVTGHWENRTTHSVPEEIEKKYQEVRAEYSEVNTEGAWKMQVTKAPEAIITESVQGEAQPAVEGSDGPGEGPAQAEVIALPPASAGPETSTQ